MAPLPTDEWSGVQREQAAMPRWIMDGDLGSYDAPRERLRRADTVSSSTFPRPLPLAGRTKIP